MRRAPDFWNSRPDHAVLYPYEAQPSLFQHLVTKYRGYKRAANEELAAMLVAKIITRRDPDADAL